MTFSVKLFNEIFIKVFLMTFTNKSLNQISKSISIIAFDIKIIMKFT